MSYGPCTTCNNPATGKDKLCSHCRGIIHAQQNFQKGFCNRKYDWNGIKDQKVKDAYNATGNNKLRLSGKLRALAKELGVPLAAVHRRASRLGCIRWSTIAWSPEEIMFMREYAGTKSAAWISTQLKLKFGKGRSYDAVVRKLNSIGLQAKVIEGYTLEMLCELLGIAERTLTKYVNKGMIRLDSNRRVPDLQVRRFLRSYPHLWSFRRVNEEWVKGMLFDVNPVDLKSDHSELPRYEGGEEENADPADQD